MSYEITANKKRPRTFDSLAGQEFVVATLKNSVLSKKVAHAYLFSGPRGVGKTSAARILSATLNCENLVDGNPCGVCDSCQEIKSGSSLDVIEIDGASNTSINDVKVIQDEIVFMPNKGRYKVYIIDEVHMLSISAFNALLKTIEEPPAHVIFIFATTELHKVPATIKSRCQQFNFRLINIDVIKNLLIDVCGDLKIDAEEEALLWIAKEATGSLRDAYTLFDQVLSFSDKKITLNKIREKLGFIDFDKVDNLAELIFEQDREKVFNLADDLISFGVSVEQFIVDLAEYFRNILLIKSGVKKESILGYKAERFSQKIVTGFKVSSIEEIIKNLFELYKDIKFSLNPRFEFELTLSKLCNLKHFLSKSDILDDLKKLKDHILNSADTIISDSKKIEKVEILNPDMQDEKFMHLEQLNSSELKDKILNELRVKDPFIAGNFSSSTDWRLSNFILIISFESKYYKDIALKNITEVEKILNKITGKEYKVKLEYIDISLNKENVEKKSSEVDNRVDIAKEIFMADEVKK